jgi:FKBP-type peptidyl-prolyl cis-trans isomerase FklB
MQHKTPLSALAAAALVAAAALPAGAQTRSPAAALAPAASASSAQMSEKDRLSYATGVVSIRNYLKNEIPFNLDMIIQGMRDAQAGKDLAMSEKEVRAVMNQLQTDLRRNMAANRKELLEKNRTRGSEFLAAYKAKPGAQALSNGVAYRVIKAGTGPKPLEQDTVVVKYRGALIDGTEFDATPDDKTALLKLNSVIMGWREALKQMPVGSKWEIVIPGPLAYGERGVGDVIAPNETLVFDVELVDIKR